MNETDQHLGRLAAKLEVLCEVVKRIDENVEKQNGSVAKLKEWQIQHIEQAIARDREIEATAATVRALGEELRPVRVVLKYPLVFTMGVLTLYALAISDIRHPLFAAFGLN